MVDHSENKKSCFVIMPISDTDGYEDGHFSRVYEHLIKPACENSGLLQTRADDINSSNYIMIDILSRIIESDLVICDLSSRNPNVLYELGIRQAFNLPTVLIKDQKTDKIFDIQGIRTTTYDHNLRIDSVSNDIDFLSKAIQETNLAKGKDVNSLVSLLGVKTAKVTSEINLSGETSIILSAINSISNKINKVESRLGLDAGLTSSQRKSFFKEIQRAGEERSYLINDIEMKLGDDIYIEGKRVGVLSGIGIDGIDVIDKHNKLVEIDSKTLRHLHISNIK